MDDADDDGGLSGPFIAFGGVVDRAVVGANPAESGGTGVALADGVRGDKAEGALGAEEIKGAAEEVGDEVGVTVGFLVEDFEPVEVAGGAARDEGVLAREWRIADKGVEAGVFAVKDFGELDFPVERG